MVKRAKRTKLPAKSPEESKVAYHHGDLRRALVDASLSLVATGGVGALSLREAARLAGVSTAAPYHHFKNRDELVAAIAIEGFEGMHRAMLAEVALVADENPALRFAAVGRGYVGFAVRNRAHFQVMFAMQTLCVVKENPALERASTPVGALLLESVAAVHGLMGKSKKKSEAVSMQNLARLAWATVHGISWLLLEEALLPALAGPSDEVAAETIATFVSLFASRLSL